MTTKKDTNINDALRELSGILKWFESQEEIGLDVEEGLRKVKQAAELIKLSKGRLAQIDNEFKEIEKEIRDEIGGSVATAAKAKKVPASSAESDDVDPDEIPF
jgi:hypothetical protein